MQGYAVLTVESKKFETTTGYGLVQNNSKYVLAKFTFEESRKVYEVLRDKVNELYPQGTWIVCVVFGPEEVDLGALV